MYIYIYIYIHGYIYAKNIVICLDTDMKMDVRIYIYTHVYARPRMKRYEQVSGLVKEVFTQKSFYREKPLRTKTFTQRDSTQKSLYTQKLWRTDAFMARRDFYTEEPLHHVYTKKYTSVFAHKSLCAPKFLQTKSQRSLCTEEFSPTNAFTYEAFTDKTCTEKLLRFPPLRFHLSTSAFQSVHIVRNSTSKLPSVKYTQNLHDQTQALSFHSASSSLGTL